MANLNDTGVYQLPNKNWAFRYTIVVDGRKKDVRKAKDEFGNPFKTKTAAIKARTKAVAMEREGKTPAPKVRKTVTDVYTEFCESGRKDRAYQTKRKQDSLWRNHISKRFGSRFVDDISTAEVNDYLSELYYDNDLSYQYTQSFLKMFYLIFGQAYSRNYLDVDIYNKLCVNKDSKIKMPKIKAEDVSDVVSFSNEELALLDNYFKGTNAETAYLLGRYCGLRINEAYGLKWSNVDLENGTLTIDRQMQYQNGLIKLIPPKTIHSKRTIYLCPAIQDHLTEKFKKRAENLERFAEVQAQRQRFIYDLDGSKISSTELVTCLPNGTIQTVNSMKYPTREIKRKLGISFKFHILRHTYGTLMAEMNTPAHLLCNQMGHGNINVTQRYYIAVSKRGIDLLRDNLSQL